MSDRSFADFDGVFIGTNEFVYSLKDYKNQALDCSNGGSERDHLSMLVCVFAVCTTFGLSQLPMLCQL